MKRLIAASLLLLPFVFANEARATLEDSFARDFQSAASQSFSFDMGRTAALYRNTDDKGYGFHLNGVMGDNGSTPSLSAGLSNNQSGREDMAELEHTAQLSTFLLNGTYDLPARVAGGLPLRPFVSGGIGVALYDTSSMNFAPEDRGMSFLPVFKVGTGVALRMGEEMNLSFSYQVGLASTTTGGDASVQMFDVSLKYRF